MQREAARGMQDLVGDLRDLIVRFPQVNAEIDLWRDLKKTTKQEDLTDEEWSILKKAYIDHLIWRFRYPADTFKQQRISSWIITLTVIVLIICGVGFSILQLIWALKVGNLSSLTTDLAIKAAGELSFRSSLVGATVLIISLVFFYLYLRHVFKIQYPIPPHIGWEGSDFKRWRRILEDYRTEEDTKTPESTAEKKKELRKP